MMQISDHCRYFSRKAAVRTNNSSQTYRFNERHAFWQLDRGLGLDPQGDLQTVLINITSASVYYKSANIVQIYHFQHRLMGSLKS